MPSFEIPETVIGVPLFVPHEHNFFEIEAGGMPNGDDCLKVRGDLGRNYKAFQEAQLVTPNIFRSGDSINWAMVVWLKLAAHANIATATPAQTLITVSTVDADQTTAEAHSGGGTLARTLWGLYAKGTNGLYFRRYASNGGFAANSPAAASGNLPVSVWQMLTVNMIGTNNVALYLNDNVAAAGSGAGGTYYGIANANRSLCIGAYSSTSPSNGREGVWRIGKLSFHNHNLTLAERQSLWNAMHANAADSLDQAIAALNPLVYLKLNETSGTVATDYSGNGRNGTYAGTYTQNSLTGADGQPTCLFNNGRVTIPTSTIYNRDTVPGLTFFALIRPTSGSGRRFIVTRGGASNYDWGFTCDPATGALTLASHGSGGSTKSAASTSGGVALNDWTAVAGSMASGLQLADIKLYTDSATDTAGVESTTANDANYNAGDIWIGDRQDGGTTEFIGQIARLAIFPGVKDVSALMAAAATEGW